MSKKRFFIKLLLFVAIVIVTLTSLTLFDLFNDTREWRRLAKTSPATPLLFDPKMVHDLPEPARRFFNFAITPGTPLLPVAEIYMGGQFSLGSKENPNYQPMEARQILASPHGFVWRLYLPGIIPISGSDSGKWTRFRILGLFPVARMGGNPDHTRAAFGRFVAESIFWTPAAVLPCKNIRWQKVDNNTARVTITNGDLSQDVDVRVDEKGRPVIVSFLRWSNANKDKIFRFQPFGGRLSDFREVQGYRIPFKVEASNMCGTEEEFTFFKAEIKEIHFLNIDK